VHEELGDLDCQRDDVGAVVDDEIGRASGRERV
jgi:hypothetical protein